MTAQAALRTRYLNDSVTTASPARLLTMLYDRLVLDLTIAEQSFGGQDLETASSRLHHAQEIIIELRTSLDVDAWSGGPALASLYTFMLSTLIQANVKRDATQVGSVRSLVEPLRDAWHEAALTTALP